MAVGLDRFYTACPGICLSREIDAVLAGLPATSSDAAILAAVSAITPLPPQPNVLLPVDGQSYLGTVATFAKGLPRFVDTNPDPRDGWALDNRGWR